MVIACNGNHSRIVRSKLELRQIRIPATFLALLLDTIPETAVRRNAATNGNLLDTCHLGRLDEFVQQNIYQCFLETCTDILLVLFHEIRILGHLIAHEIKERSLDATETVVQPRDMGLRELETVRITKFCKLVNDRAARIAEAHHLGALVKSLPHSVVDCLTENFIVKRTVHLDYLRVAS